LKIEEKLKIIENFIGQDPLTYIEKNYNENIIKIMIGEMTDEITEVLNSCKYNADYRNPQKYAQELIIAWVLEDFISNTLNNLKGLKSHLNGSDKKRELLSKKNVTTELDLIITRNIRKQKFEVEIIADFAGFWVKNKKGHLRDNKFLKLQKRAKEKKVCILLLDVKNRKFCFIPITKDTEAIYIKNHMQFGFKPAFEINIDCSKFKDIDLLMDNNYLINLLNGGYIVIIKEVDFSTSFIYYI